MVGALAAMTLTGWWRRSHAHTQLLYMIGWFDQLNWMVGHTYSITTKQCICVVLDLVNRPYKCSKTSAFLTSTWFLLTSCSVDKSPFYAGADPFQSEPEFRTLRNAPTFQTEIRLPSFLGAGKAPDLHKRQTVARDTPSSISTTGRRTKASSGRPLKLRRGSGRAGTALMHPRDGAAWSVTTASIFSFMDELHQSATGRTQHAHAQLKVFTFLFLECDQLPAKPRQCWLCRPCDVRRAASDLTVRNAGRAVERKKEKGGLRRDADERKEKNRSECATPTRRKKVHPCRAGVQGRRGKWRHWWRKRQGEVAPLTLGDPFHGRRLRRLSDG